MAAARSRGRTASAWSGVRVPERNAATKARIENRGHGRHARNSRQPAEKRKASSEG